MNLSIRGLCLLFLSLNTVAIIGCDAAKKAVEDASSGPLAESSVAGAWTSACTAATDPITGSVSYKDELTLNADGTFSEYIYWYSGANCMSYSVIYSNSGTFSVGSYLVGSSGGQLITFNITTSREMAYTNAVQTSFNNNCGGTSPYAGGVANGNNGVWHSTYMMLCMSQDLPNSGNAGVGNNVEMVGGVLMLGAGEAVVPGVFSGGTIPASATIPYN